MTYFADDAPVDCGSRLRFIGWLEPEHAYTKGPVDRAFVAKLCELFVMPKQFAASAGPHCCRLCRFSRGARTFHLDGHSISLGNTNLLVPAGDFAYYTPSLVLHYLDSHEYCPPPEFVEAVMRCPPSDSHEYLVQAKAACPALVMFWARGAR